MTVVLTNMKLKCLVSCLIISACVFGRLVVDTKDQLMISDREGSTSLDLMRIVQEGDKVNTTVVESECPGVMEETWFS